MKNAVSYVKDFGIRFAPDFKRAYRCAVAAKKAKGENIRLISELSCRNVNVVSFNRAFVRTLHPGLVSTLAKVKGRLERTQRLAT